MASIMKELKVEEIRPAEYNPREITPEALEGLKQSIKKFGLVENLVVNKDMTLIAGHQRLRAAIALGIKSVPCYVLDVDKKTEKLLNVTLNNPNIQGTFVDTLQDILKEFTLEELEPLRLNELLLHIEEEKEVEEDDFEAPKEAKYKVEKGDIFQLGNHILMCGDSTSLEDVTNLFVLSDEKAKMIFTDPPYNADYSSRVDKTRRKPWGGIMNDNMTHEAFDDFLLDINTNLHMFLEEGGACYECIDWKHYAQLARIFADAFDHKSSIIWNKNYFGLGTYYRTKYEMILFGIKGEKLSVWNGNHDEMDVWSEDREILSNYVHPTQKPITLAARAIKNSSNTGDIVLDLFGGSGSTLMACEQLERNCYMMELDPYYTSVIIERWETFTKQQHKKLQ